MKALFVIGIILLALVMACITAALTGWILMLVLGAIGVNWGFWPCFGICLVLSILFGGGSRVSR